MPIMNRELSQMAAFPDGGKSSGLNERRSHQRKANGFLSSDIMSHSCRVGTSSQHLALGCLCTFPEFAYISPLPLLRMSDCLLSTALPSISIPKKTPKKRAYTYTYLIGVVISVRRDKDEV